ncbi:hypothetical protein BGW36DRAFT_294211 [Talaromyces proteolyticus]|uniref:SMODS and SLOG-associating 2TM effector domain-containing protein n=1 Tax=Talaromyces proteolyticus TaxID=1131652 RepID=A0AAD4KT34_9EURO|nr:uncharacterized protein BGW36DRAFT_294211 [Talaromyces proteolyticus]KAH8698702.1 hypothetical protein BGW36DRAFT_294211 [Talaromyces proteolyticus]
MKRFFSFDREEKGLPPVEGNAPKQPSYYPNSDSSQINPQLTEEQERERTSQLYHNRAKLIPADNKLLIFRSLTGIDHVPVLSKDGFFQPRHAPNVGIYTRVVQAEKTAALRYRAFSILINTCLSVQIVVAAALTAIGAAKGPHGVITAFGAINTIMAGILTYLRGSGLPNREKNVEKAWGQIREYIEQREREFCLESCALNVEEEIRIIEQMYEEVRLQMESGNSNDGSSRGSAKSIDAIREARKSAIIGQNSGAVKEALSGHTGIEEARTAVAAESGRAENNLRDRLGQYGDQLRNTSDNGRVGNIRDELRHVGDYFRQAGENIQHRGEDIRQTGESMRQTGEEQLRHTGEQVQQAGENLRNPELRVSIQTTQSNSKQTQTDKDFQ